MLTVEKIKMLILDSGYRFDYLSSKGFLDGMDDEKYLRKKYELTYKRKLDLENPKLFSEKMQWLKLYDRNPAYTQLVDKFLCKKIIENKVGNGYTIPTIGTYRSFDEIDFDKLPNEFVLKTNHDSGGVIVCRDKKNFNQGEAKKKIEKKLKNNFYYYCREWCYKDVKPLILIEPLLKCQNVFGDDGLIDYKFYCFSGKPHYLMVSYGEADKKHINHKYNMNFESIDSEFRKKQLVKGDTFTKPENYEKMVALVEKLCAEYPHVRVDLYNIEGKIYIGELTLYSNGGFISLPQELDQKLGELIDLKMAYNVKGRM